MAGLPSIADALDEYLMRYLASEENCARIAGEMPGALLDAYVDETSSRIVVELLEHPAEVKPRPEILARAQGLPETWHGHPVIYTQLAPGKAILSQLAQRRALEALLDEIRDVSPGERAKP